MDLLFYAAGPDLKLAGWTGRVKLKYIRLPRNGVPSAGIFSSALSTH